MPPEMRSAASDAAARPSPDPRAAAADLLRSGAGSERTIWMEVRGDSMLPTLLPGDRVEVGPADAMRLRFGDLVVLDIGEAGWVIHRFFWRRRGEPLRFRTKGDHRTYFDPAWAGSGLIGRLRRLERQGRRRECGRAWLWLGAVRSILVWARARVRGRRAAECRP